jgi:ribosomal protein L19E
MLEPICLTGSYSDLSGRGGRWSIEEEKLLHDGTKAGKSTSELAALHNRTQVAITSRQMRLGLREIRHSKLIDPFPEFTPFSSSSLSELNSTNKLNATKRAMKRKQINKNYTTENIEELISESVVQRDEYRGLDNFALLINPIEKPRLNFVLEQIYKIDGIKRTETIMALSKDF